jgi:diaminopimelate epimerase
MGIPRFEAEDIPVVMGQILDITPILDYPLSVGGRELSLTFVSLGNPHAVCFWPEPVTGFPLAEAGPEVGRHSIFPQGVNFEVANMIDRGHLEARVWERGVGETLACGTGACAIAVAARLHGYCHNQVDIKLPGGTLTVDWDGEGEVLLTGPVELAFDGEWPEE